MTLHSIACRIGRWKPLYVHLDPGAAFTWFDAGISTTPADFLFRYLDQARLPAPEVNRVLISHADPDHFGGLAAMRGRFRSVQVIAHTLDAPLVNERQRLMTERYGGYPDDAVVLSADRLRELDERAGPAAEVDTTIEQDACLGRWRVLHLPGHSAGHLGVIDDSTGRAVIGDAVLGWGLVDFDGSPVMPPHYENVSAYLTTIQALAALPIYELHTSHFPVRNGEEVEKFLTQSRDAVFAIAECLGDALKSAPSGVTLAGLCHTVFHRLNRWPSGNELTLADPVAAHLRQEVASGNVRRFAPPDGGAPVRYAEAARSP